MCQFNFLGWLGLIISVHLVEASKLERLVSLRPSLPFIQGLHFMESLLFSFYYYLIVWHGMLWFYIFLYNKNNRFCRQFI